MGLFIRRVKTKSQATAVQVVHQDRGRRKILKHLGSAHDEAALALLEAQAAEHIEQLRGAAQQSFDFTGSSSSVSSPVVQGAGSRARVLWEVLNAVYERIGFDAVDSEVFRALVIARLIRPASKLKSLEVLERLRIGKVPSYATVKRHLAKAGQQDWRDTVCQAAYRFAAGDGAVSVVMYDVTTLYWEADSDEHEQFRRVGYSKERRVDPQILVGLLVDRHGFPLEVHTFRGNAAETATIIPVLDSFRARHQIEHMVVVADAAMLSEANVKALDEAGYGFIIANRIGKMPHGLMAKIDAEGNNFANGQTFTVEEKIRKNSPRAWRTVYHFSWKRYYRDQQNLNKQAQRAWDQADGRRPVKRDRFVKVSAANVSVNEDQLATARKLQGIKGYVTNIGTEVLNESEIVGAYHQLFEVEASFRIAKHDLAARPIFHRKEDMIEAHLTIVFAALGIARHIQQATGLSIERVIDELEPLVDPILEINGTQHTYPAKLTDAATQIINALGLTRDLITGH